MNSFGIKKILLILIVAAAVSAPFTTHAAPKWWPIVPCGLQKQPDGVTLTDENGKPWDYTQECNQCLLIQLADNLVDLTFFWVVPVIGTAFIIFGGLKIIIGGSTGNPGMVSDGQKIFRSTLVGAAIILSSWVITNFILRSLAGNNNISQDWYSIKCSTGTLQSIVNQTAANPPGSNSGNNTGNTGGNLPSNPSNGIGALPGQAITIQGVAVSAVSATTATITWTTNQPSDSQVTYSTDNSYNQNSNLDPASVTSHSVSISGLTPNTDYNLKAVSGGSESGNLSFKTLLESHQLLIPLSSLPSGLVGQDYSQTISVEGGSVPYTFGIASGTLPDGINLDTNTGVLSGRPTAPIDATFTIQVQDTTGQKLLKQMRMTIEQPTNSGLACMYNGVNYSTANLCSGQPRPGGCGTNVCSQYSASIQTYASAVGIDPNLLKSFMVIESDCRINPSSNFGTTSFGLMQITPQYAAPYAVQCGVSPTGLTQSWLTDPANADKSICIAAHWIKGLAGGTCGSNPGSIYAGYNGGDKACQKSNDCTNNDCSNRPTEAWECPYDTKNGQQTCNTGYYQTKQGASYINYCINNLGF